jgi:FMN-dependent NADH-azoreductase
VAIVLHLSASPKAENSASERLAEAFLQGYRRSHPGDDIRRLNVFETPPPDFGRVQAEAKFEIVYGQVLKPEAQEAWDEIAATIEYFYQADKVIVSSPMWNYHVPWRLKQYIDCLLQPGMTFGYDRIRMQHTPLLRNRPVQLLLTRSSIMPGDQNDYQLPYLKFVFSLIGLADVRALTAWQTTRPSVEDRVEYIEGFADQAFRLGAEF